MRRRHLRRYVNLDYAASTPVMAAVWDAVEAFVPCYSSVHRGTGAKSQISTAAYEHARDDVASFVGRRTGTVVFVRNTTEAINVLATALPAEHAGALDPGRAPRQHAPLAPARPAPAPVPALGRAAARRPRAGAQETQHRPARRHRRLERHRRGVAARRARRRSPTRTARSCSSTPPSSRRTARSTWRRAAIDHLALSGHKLYAPFGAGALVSAAARSTASRCCKGGGAIKLVTSTT